MSIQGKVLQVIPSVSAGHGGPSVAIRLIEAALGKLGVAVETATTDDDGPGRRLPRATGLLVEEGGASRRYFAKTADTYKISLPLARWLLGHVRDYRLVHIHAMFSFSSTIAAWSARLAGVPYVVRPLGTLSAYGMGARRPWAKRLSMALVEGPILRHAAAVHFTSAMEQAEAEGLGFAMRPVIIPLAVPAFSEAAVEPLLAKFPALRGQRWAVYLSRLDRKKNVEGLLQAIALCRQELPDVRWLIAGDGEVGYVDQLHSLAGQLGLNDRVIWAGHLQGAEKAAALAHAQLFVLPSHSENFGIAAAEALQAGLPVVLGEGVALSGLATRHGAGRTVQPTPEAIAEGLRAYLNDPQARERAASCARELAVREFSLDTMGARLQQLYAAILAAPDHRWHGDTGHG